MSVLKRILFLLFVVFTIAAKSQSAITVKYFGLTIHPFGDNSAALMPYKLDKRAKFVLNFGAFAGYEKYMYEDFISAKVIQGVFTDCSAGLAGFTHIGLRGVLIDRKSHRLSFGVGPTLLYRDSWSRFGESYTSSGFFNEYYSRNAGAIQWKFFIAGFEFEYDYRINAKNDLSLSFTPGIPMACIFSVGFKHWISKDFKKRLRLSGPVK